MAKQEWYKITVVYRSGTTREFVTDRCTTRYTGGTLTELGWGAIRPGSRQPLHIGINDIESVWSIPV